MKCVILLMLAMMAIGAAAADPVLGTASNVAAGSLERGKQVFDYWCASCHAADPREGGRFLPGTASLQAKYRGALPAALEERKDLLAEFTQWVIRKGIEGMPFFRKTEISDQDMQAVAAYLARNVGK